MDSSYLPKAAFPFDAAVGSVKITKMKNHRILPGLANIRMDSFWSDTKRETNQLN